MEDCLFCKIRDGIVPANFVYQDELVMVFPDIHPKKPIHLLIVPKKHTSEFVAIDDMKLMQDIGKVIKAMIKEKKLERNGYRIEINGGGYQEIDHLHIHLVGPMK